MSIGKEIDPHESPRALFAYELRRFRQSAELTQKQLGERIGFSDSMVNLVELAKRPPSQRFAELCDQALGLDGTMVRLYTATRWKHSPEHFRPWLEEEQEATGLWCWEPTLVPGLLQTEEYARRVFGASLGITGDEIEGRVVARMQRRAILNRPCPPAVGILMDEAVIRRPIGGAVVMTGQLRFLMEIAEHPQVTIQIVPYETDVHAGLTGGFIIAERNGTAYAGFAEAQPYGRTVDDQPTLNRLARVYDRIRAEALPFRQSLRLIEEVVNQSGS
ncbi:transcriptional regulator [Sphaerisporangium krabiense]|uniref:Transcriptional regulator with XRE-family HTH domain n=1 Tax=Sphaerisporangium krabiense TaxID=763782 RepID=A0A7W8Z4X2_9ACTN|nr:helix-turn-helix transcriptional regulator [Sphaerisporangium krabiense]MBB5627455.1 transcriptional regulator with XRE-family HTH domain [Sphaerisporangium krabiense]GII64407.1 transcriptional regulator [Sphaerisporangium krabiense]